MISLVSKFMSCVVLLEVLKDGLALKANRFDLFGLSIPTELKKFERATSIVLCFKTTKFSTSYAASRHHILIVFFHYCIVYVAIVVL